MSLTSTSLNAASNILNNGYAYPTLQPTGTPISGASWKDITSNEWVCDLRIERVENGYILSQHQGGGPISRRWIAASVQELQDQITAALVLNRMEGK